MLIAIGVDWDGAARSSRSRWPVARAAHLGKDFLLGLLRRGLNGVQFVVADNHAGLRQVLPEAAFQSLTVTIIYALGTWPPVALWT